MERSSNSDTRKHLLQRHPKTMKGGWHAARFIISVEFAQQFVFIGLSSNLITYLTSELQETLIEATKNINTWANSELSSHQKKIFKVDDHIGVAIARLTADGRVLSRYMRNECINYSYTYQSPLPVGRLVVQLADKAQLFSYDGGISSPSVPCDMWWGVEDICISMHIKVCTQRSWKRPYGVGLLVGGMDESEAHLYHNCMTFMTFSVSILKHDKLFFVALYVISIGDGGIKSTCQLFCRLLYCLCTGQYWVDCRTRVASKGVDSANSSDFYWKKRYKRENPEGSPFATMAQVLVAASLKWRPNQLPTHDTSLCYYGLDDDHHPLPTLEHTHHLK
ncbi:hypothetical protein HN873_049044 [Arachis hypogaea]